MTADITRATGLRALRTAMEEYCPLDDETWAGMESICSLTRIDKDEFFTRPGEVPTSFGFVCRGLLRVFATREDGQQYNKVFFPEGTFPGSMVALLTGSAAALAIQAIEPTTLLRIDFGGYRRLLEARADLKWFQILYLEKNWLIGKERREVALVQENATERYLRFRRENPGLEPRLAQYHVASHVGVTPTQLSRIRRELGKKKPPPST